MKTTRHTQRSINLHDLQKETDRAVKDGHNLAEQHIIQQLIDHATQLEELINRATSVIAASDNITMERWQRWLDEIEGKL